jgi:uncharacterized protein
VREDVKYCPHCGAYQETEDSSSAFNTVAMRAVLIFYFISLFICLLARLDSVVSDVSDYLVLTIVDAIVIIVFTVINFHELKRLFSFRNVKPVLMLGVMLAAIAGALLVNVFAESLNRNLFNDESYFYYFYSRDVANPIVWMILMIAVYPALFEEISFRGFMHNYVRKMVDWRATLLITAFLFALMHLSIFSFIWLFPFGWLLAWLRHKHDTLWYGIVFHFLFNLTAVFYELWTLDVI